MLKISFYSDVSLNIRTNIILVILNSKQGILKGKIPWGPIPPQNSAFSEAYIRLILFYNSRLISG